MKGQSDGTKGQVNLHGDHDGDHDGENRVRDVVPLLFRLQLIMIMLLESFS